MFLVPVERDNPTRHRCYVVWALLALNIGIWLATLPIGDQELYRNWGFIPSDPEWVTAVTSMFLHAGPLHLLGNMFFLWMYGDNVEDVVGPLAFGFLYFFLGGAALLAHFLAESQSDIPLVGASGAISGVLGIYLAFFPNSPNDLVLHFGRWEAKTFRLTTKAAVGFWFTEQLVFGLLMAATSLGNYIGIAFWAHIGGLVAGFLVGLMLIRLGFVRRYNDNGPRHPFIGYVG